MIAIGPRLLQVAGGGGGASASHYGLLEHREDGVSALLFLAILLLETNQRQKL